MIEHVMEQERIEYGDTLMSVGRIKLKYIFRLERMFTISHCLVTYSRKFSRTDSYASVWRLKGVIRNHSSNKT